MKFREAYIAGLIVPSALSVSTLAIVCGILVFASLIYLPVFMSKPEARFFANAGDDNFYVTAELFNLENSVADDRPVFAIVGGSVTQSSFGGTRMVAKDLEAKFGQTFDVRLMTSGRQNILDHLLVFEHMPQDRPVLAVLGIGPSRFTWQDRQYVKSYETNRFGKSSPTYLAKLREANPDMAEPTGFVQIDHLQFYTTRIDRLGINVIKRFTGAVPHRNENEYIDRQMDEEEYHSHSSRVVGRFEGADTAIAKNHSRLAELLDFVKARGNIQLVVMEHPIRPEFVTDFLGEDRYAQHLQDMRRIMANADIPYFTPGLDLRLTTESFFDWAHIRSRGTQDKLRSALLDQFQEVSP